MTSINLLRLTLFFRASVNYLWIISFISLYYVLFETLINTTAFSIFNILNLMQFNLVLCLCHGICLFLPCC
uniref:Uncharacterized protein n=1 Tax=Solanum lycopersicum TaxID=4081 RepID=A0A3Q7HM56_SOLLC